MNDNNDWGPQYQEDMMCPQCGEPRSEDPEYLGWAPCFNCGYHHEDENKVHENSSVEFDKFMNEIIKKEDDKVIRENAAVGKPDSWGRQRDLRYRDMPQNRIRYTR